MIQPAPAELDGVADGEATDIAYISTGGSFTDDEEEEMSVRERLGILLVAYQDGRVDVCLDVEKVEARWEGDRVSCLSRTYLAFTAYATCREREGPYRLYPFMRRLTLAWRIPLRMLPKGNCFSYSEATTL